MGQRLDAVKGGRDACLVARAGNGVDMWSTRCHLKRTTLPTRIRWSAQQTLVAQLGKELALFARGQTVRCTPRGAGQRLQNERTFFSLPRKFFSKDTRTAVATIFFSKRQSYKCRNPSYESFPLQRGRARARQRSRGCLAPMRCKCWTSDRFVTHNNPDREDIHGAHTVPDRDSRRQSALPNPEKYQRPSQGHRQGTTALSSQD